MEGITTRVYRRVKGYWQRRRYVRLGGNGSGLNRRGRGWRLKKKLKLRYYSPKKLLTRLRDGYMNMMMRMANSPVVAGIGGYGEGVEKYGMRSVRGYDDNLTAEMYKMSIF